MPEYQQLMKRLDDGEVLILDGATGSETERLGISAHDQVWCAMATETHPDVVREIHENYIRAGAEIITTNTFTSGRDVLDGAGLGHKCDDLNRRSAELAQEARDAAGNRPVWIAGSIAAFGDWEEMDKMQMRSNIARQAEVLAEAGVDLFLLEMLGADGPLTKAAIEETSKTGLPVWVALSCVAVDSSSGLELGTQLAAADAPMRYGTGTFGESAAEIKEAGGDVFLVFHSQVDVVREAIRQLQESVGGHVGVYPHCGEWKQPNWQFVNMISPVDYLDEAQTWVEAGAQIVGGCCGIGLDHMKVLGGGLPRSTR